MQTTATFIRYLLVQGFGYLADIGFFTLFYMLGIPILTSNALGKVIASVFCFASNRSFTFADRERQPWVNEALRYAAMQIGYVLVSSCVLLAMVRFLGESIIVKFMCDCSLIVLSFAVARKFVFRQEVAI